MTRIQKCMGTWSASSSCQVRRGAWAAAEMTAGCPFMILIQGLCPSWGAWGWVERLYIEGVGYRRTHTHTTSILADGSNL